MSKPEAKFQTKLWKWLEEQGFKVIRVKASANQNKSKPDLAVFYGKFWGWLECKRSATAPFRPGQKENVAWAQKNSYGAAVYPENVEQIKAELLEQIGGE